MRFEGAGKTSCRAIVTYTSAPEADAALKGFDKSALKKDKNSNLTIDLKVYAHNKEEQSLNKIFARNIIPNTEEEAIKKAF